MEHTLSAVKYEVKNGHAEAEEGLVGKYQIGVGMRSEK